MRVQLWFVGEQRVVRRDQERVGGGSRLFLRWCCCRLRLLLLFWIRVFFLVVGALFLSLGQSPTGGRAAGSVAGCVCCCCCSGIVTAIIMDGTGAAAAAAAVADLGTRNAVWQPTLIL